MENPAAAAVVLLSGQVCGVCNEKNATLLSKHFWSLGYRLYCSAGCAKKDCGEVRDAKERKLLVKLAARIARESYVDAGGRTAPEDWQSDLELSQKEYATLAGMFGGGLQLRSEVLCVLLRALHERTRENRGAGSEDASAACIEDVPSTQVLYDARVPVVRGEAQYLVRHERAPRRAGEEGASRQRRVFITLALASHPLRYALRK